MFIDRCSSCVVRFWLLAADSCYWYCLVFVGLLLSLFVDCCLLVVVVRVCCSLVVASRPLFFAVGCCV